MMIVCLIGGDSCMQTFFTVGVSYFLNRSVLQHSHMFGKEGESFLLSFSGI